LGGKPSFANSLDQSCWQSWAFPTSRASFANSFGPFALCLAPCKKTHGKDNVPAAGVVTLPCAGQKTHGKVTYIFLFFSLLTSPFKQNHKHNIYFIIFIPGIIYIPQ
jgi:hypothetical protein